jgi:hypothetical protein
LRGVEFISASQSTAHAAADFAGRANGSSTPRVLRTLSARQFIHDGIRSSEGDAAYSWIWVQESCHLRLLLGSVPRGERQVRVTIPRSSGARNLKEIRLLMNGLPLPTRVDRWDEEVGSGVASAEFLSDGRDHVLGVAVRECLPLEADGPPLSVCLDRVDIR